MYELVSRFAIFAIFAIWIIGVFKIFIGMEKISQKISLYGFLLAALGLILITHPAWGAWWLFLTNAAGAVPTWAWVVAGVTVYFNLNKIYTSWLDYASHHPGSLAEKILGPPPSGLPCPTQFTTGGRFILRILGIWFLCISWLITLTWLVFGGAAKLLHLVPRE